MKENSLKNTLDIISSIDLDGNEYYVEITHDNNICLREIDSAILSVNISFTLQDDSFSICKNTPTFVDVYSNDNNLPSSGTISITQGSNGSVILRDPNNTPNNPSDDEIIYIPNSDYFGSDTFDYSDSF